MPPPDPRCPRCGSYSKAWTKRNDHNYQQCLVCGYEQDLTAIAAAERERLALVDERGSL